MATSQSVTKEDKKVVKELIKNDGIKVFYFPEYNCTVAIRSPIPRAKFLHVSIALAGKSEPRFSKSLGKYCAVFNMNERRYFPFAFNIDNVYPMGVYAQRIAQLFGYSSD